MFLGRVIGRLVPPIRHPRLEGGKLLWVQPLDAFQKNSGNPLIALDSVGAGNGEIVFMVSAMEASFAVLPTELVPADCAIVGIVDNLFAQKQESSTARG